MTNCYSSLLSKVSNSLRYDVGKICPALRTTKTIAPLMAMHRDNSGIPSRDSLLIHRRCSSTHASSGGGSPVPSARTGAGFGNVSDQMLSRSPDDAATTGRPPLFQHMPDPHTCSIIGAPMTFGQPFAGTDSGPALLRDAGLRAMLTRLGWRVEDMEDLMVDSNEHSSSGSFQKVDPSRTINARNSELVGKGAFKLYETMKQKFRDGTFPLVLGGDHSIGIGSLASILSLYPDTGILWIDAHADLNTPYISESGNMHGMPIGLHMKGAMPEPGSPDNASTIPGLEWLQEHNIPQLNPQNIVYIGLRDVDPAERRLIRSLNIQAYTMHEIDRYGIGQTMELALEHLLKDNPNRRLHLSYDIDSIDPILAPATGTTVRGGLTYREAHYVAERVAYSGNLASAEIVELNPTLSHSDGARETVELGLRIITSFMGKSII